MRQPQIYAVTCKQLWVWMKMWLGYRTTKIQGGSLFLPVTERNWVTCMQPYEVTGIYSDPIHKTD